MANRQFDTQLDVTNVTAAMPNQLVGDIASYGQKVVDQAADAKVTQGISAAQLELAELSNRHRIEYESNPTDGLQQFDEARTAIFAKYAEEVPVYYRGAFQTEAEKLAKASDISNETWKIKQSEQNAVTDINKSMGNYLNLANTYGQQFANQPLTALDTTLNLDNARASLEAYGAKYLGAETTAKVLKDFDADYAKVFVSGLAEKNPAKALKLLENPTIQEKVGGEHWADFKSAIEHRAVRVQKNMEQGGVLSTIKRDNAPLSTSGGKMTYAELNSANLSPVAKEYYSALNGFSGNGKRGGFTPEDKAGFKMAIFDNVQRLATDPNMDAQSVRVVQDSIYKAMNKGAITQAQGMEYINQIVNPLIDKKEKAMSKFSEDTWFTDAIGFEGVQDYYDKNLKRDTAGLSKDMQRTVEVSNTTNKAKLYDYYMGALMERANKAGVPVADVPNLSPTQRNKIYSEAQTEAIRLNAMDRTPALRTMPDLPNLVYDATGHLVQGLTGPRNLKPDATAKAAFKLQVDDKTNEIFRVYPNGIKEKVR